MKKCLIFILFPAFVWAVELHPEEECEDFKSDLLHDLLLLQTTNSYARAELGYAENWLTDSSNKLSTALHNLDNGDYGSAAQLDLRYYIDSALYDVNLSLASVLDATKYNNSVTYQISSLKSKISAVDCTSCSNTNCCDFSEIIAAIQELEDNQVSIQETLVDIYDQITYLESILNELQYTNFLLEHGFYNVTNNLNILNYNLSHNTTNLNAAIDKLYWFALYKKNNNSNSPLQVSATSRTSPFYTPQFSGYLSSYWWQLDFLSQSQISLNNYLYNLEYREIPILTNTVGRFHRDTTNYFSFFRGEIGVNGVLSDWQSEQVSGSYHDFLTNHYLAVVRGGPLSGNQSSKTNWFSRIETLLAALVFTDTTETNTVDTSAGNQERQQLATSYETANQAAATFSEDFKSTSQSIVSLYRSYFNTFENAAMPSHVVLMRLSSDDSEDIEISFQSDSLGILVESCRVVTTLCWSSVGIFLLYKFLVWSARCVILACQFIYRAISSVFKS